MSRIKSEIYSMVQTWKYVNGKRGGVFASKEGKAYARSPLPSYMHLGYETLNGEKLVATISEDGDIELLDEVKPQEDWVLNPTCSPCTWD